jgi:hypothetical protein
MSGRGGNRHSSVRLRQSPLSGWFCCPGAAGEHHDDLAQRGEVVQGVAGNDEDVGVPTRLESPGDVRDPAYVAAVAVVAVSASAFDMPILGRNVDTP